MAEKEIKKIALIISGGTCRGAAQVAFINELIKRVGLERICVISASSIQGGGRFIRNQKMRMAGQGNCYDDPLLHSSGELVRVFVGPVGRDSDLAEHLDGLVVGLLP